MTMKRYLMQLLVIVMSIVEEVHLPMEGEGAAVLRNRSSEHNNIRYKWMVYDADSKSFNTVNDTYPGCKVVKLDCVGHVQKRMGKHLLNLKARTKGKLADGRAIGGHGHLSDDKI